MRQFIMDDWMSYAGAEPFKDGSDPEIEHLEKSGFVIIADRNMVTIIGNIATKDLVYNVADRPYNKAVMLQIANEWAKELKDLDAKDLVMLMHAIGINSVI